MSILLKLSPHLRESINTLLDTDVKLPAYLYEAFLEAMNRPEVVEKEAMENISDIHKENHGCLEPKELEQVDPVTAPPTIELKVIDELSRWATSEEGLQLLRQGGHDPLRYTTIALLSGTEMYIPASELAKLKAIENSDKFNPYLPSYLSPAPPSIGSEYRDLMRTLSTVFNILFSIIGSAGAVYVASVTGAGYTREKGILLSILAGVIVGLADGVLIVLYTRTAENTRKDQHERGRRLMQGSGGIPEAKKELEDAVTGQQMEKEGVSTSSVTSGRRLQLRRRALADTSK
ncbi:uncharacterized protein L203_101592 [Cryptococcus depauperatus CBS 7841]|uniref:Uncharacterized protein n=1 Tax=Cryptococcus depauperatus CBS 7841 TaxID=1295531 RepID=A0A1E3IT50_9TREE|nr:hypothetical protein L203_01041 [Cryptococcus depauperatus CBS 7841]